MTPRLLMAMVLATIGVVLIVVALASGEWWVLVPALLMHAVATWVVVGMVAGAAEDSDKPDPVTDARLAEERVDEVGPQRQPAQRDRV